MTGPGGTPTKRDQRRDARRGQFQQRQLERQRERQRQIWRQRTTRLAVTVSGVVLLALVLFVLIHALTGGGAKTTPKPTPTHHAQYTTPTQGEVREEMRLLTFEASAPGSKMTQWLGNRDPWDVPLSRHETAAIRYDRASTTMWQPQARAG
jgi:hypothetical protein